MKTKLSTILLLSSISLLTREVVAIDVETKTTIQTRWATSLNSNSASTALAEFSLKPEFKVRFNNDWSLNTIVRLQTEGSKKLRPQYMDTTGYSQFTKPWSINNATDFELREFYIDRSFGNHYLSIGKQQTVWGRADGLKVLDIVNPQSYNEFVLESFEDSRIPLWTANLELALNTDNTIQFLWIPDTTVHALPESNERFAFTTPRIVPQTPAGVNVELNDLNRPSSTTSDSDFGLRWTGFKNGWDFTLNYLYHYEDLPVFYQHLEITGNGPFVTVTPEFERSHLIGGTFSNSFGNLTLRGEVGYKTDLQFLSKNPNAPNGIATHDELSYVLGFDWFGFTESLVSLQILQSHLIDPSEGLTRPNSDTTLTLLANKTFLNETLKIEVQLIRNLNDSDGLIRPKLTYEWNDTLTTWIGADLFHGNQNGQFGQFKNNDRILIGAQYNF